MEAELFELDSLWMNDAPSCRFFSTVSHRHVYGLLFRLLWPLLKSFPFSQYDLAYPEQLIKSSDEPDVVIASPALLKRLGHLNAGSHSWFRVFSSGGLLPLQAAVDSERILGTSAIEVLGSTETSGIAWRRQAPGAPNLWNTLPSVAIRTDSEGFLEVKSPFSGTGSWQKTGDFAAIETARTFSLLGRGDHIVKIEDRRISLSSIEQSLMRSPCVADAAAVALDRAGRQVVGAALRLTSAGTAEIEKFGRRTFVTSLRPLLDGIEPIAIPRFYRFVDQIPENSQGKRERVLLEKLFE
jgi:acyl-coenzyme A synthetase/AMP-(fatty) acid ligase